MIIDHLPLSQTNDYRGQPQKVETESGAQVNGPPGLKEKNIKVFLRTTRESNAPVTFSCTASGLQGFLLVLAAKSCNMLES